MENGPHPVRIHWVKDSGTGPDGADYWLVSDAGAPEGWQMNPRRVFRLYPKMGLAVSGSAETLAAGESPFAYPKIHSCMTRTGPGSMRENFAVTD